MTPHTPKTLALALASLAATTSPIFANGHADPKLPKEIQPMYCLVGEWKAQNGEFTLEGKKHKADFTVACAPTAGGLAIQCQAKFDFEGLGHIEESDLFGYDAGQNRYHWFAVTGMGETHDHVALPPASEKDPVVFTYTGVQGGKPMKETIKLAFNADATRIEFRNEGTIGGQPAWLATATMVKNK